VVRLVMGVCFGCALNYVVFAGAELFTGSNLVLTLGVLIGKARIGDLLSNWVWTWLGKSRWQHAAGLDGRTDRLVR
jgi:nitrite transporter NirC